jgi:hypothetical protein
LFTVLTAHFRHQRPGWEVYAQPIARGAVLKYVIWFELDYQAINGIDIKRKKQLWSVLNQNIKRKLGKLNLFDKNFHIMITADELPPAVPDLVVRAVPC